MSCHTTTYYYIILQPYSSLPGSVLAPIYTYLLTVHSYDSDIILKHSIIIIIITTCHRHIGPWIPSRHAAMAEDMSGSKLTCKLCSDEYVQEDGNKKYKLAEHCYKCSAAARSVTMSTSAFTGLRRVGD